VVNIEKGKTSYEFIPLPARKFVTIEVTISEEQEPTNALIGEIEKYDLSEAVVRVFYTMSAEKEDLMDFKRINSALEGAFLVTTIAKRSQPEERRKRVEEITEDLGMLEAMDKYIQNNPDLVPLAEELKVHALELEKEFEGAERDRN
jgi:exonuclease SbcD